MIKPFGQFRRRGLVEAGPTPFADVPEQCELGDDEHRTADLPETPIHPALAVLEDTEIPDLRTYIFDIGRSVAVRHPDKHEKSRADPADDLSVDGHGGGRDSLDDGTHRIGLISLSGYRVIWLSKS